MKSNVKPTAALALALALGACGGGSGGGGLEELPPAPAAASAGPGDVQMDRSTPGAAYSAEEGGPPPSDGPQGSSRARPGEERYDRVGYAGYAGAGEGIFAISGVLPAGSHAEVTALDSGKTILVPVRGEGRGLIDLSGAAARQLGVTGTPAVRVRRVKASPQEISLFESGQAVPMRADAPPALLAGLRRRLGAQGEAPSPPPWDQAAASVRTPARPAAQPAQPPRAARGLFVQVAALSNAARARSLADELGGVVRPGGGVYRVQIGPFAGSAAADRARADVARRGFPDARVVSVP